MELEPIVPFEPIRVDIAPEGNEWVAQVKWDGVRILTYYNGRTVRLFNRRLHERTIQFPELTEIRKYCNASSVILDGEVIALEQGKPSFHKIMKRDSLRLLDKIPRACKEIPVTYMIFDVIYYNGHWVTDQALYERQRILSEIIINGEHVQVVENFDDPISLFEVIKANDMEGIICKELSSKYQVKGKDGRWRKLKNYRDLVAVIGGVTFRGSIVNALLLGLYDGSGQLCYIGHVGTGKLTQNEWRQLTDQITDLIINKCPFVNMPERIKSTVWVKPMMTVKVRFIEWTKGNTLRQPSVQAIVKALPEECIFE